MTAPVGNGVERRGVVVGVEVAQVVAVEQQVDLALFPGGDDGLVGVPGDAGRVRAGPAWPPEPKS